MSAQDRAIQKLAKELAGIKREVVSWRGPQLDYSSIENSGNFTFKDSDGNVTAVVGGQDDGSNTIRHVDGPTPPIPSGLSAHVDGPIVQVSWDGTFESDVTHDWHYLEVLAVGPNNEQLTGTINDLAGGETSLAATAQGDWFITARSVSRAGKRSLDGDAGTVAVQLVGLTGAIDAVQASADGKSTIYYSPTPPDAPEGGFSNGDLWFDTSEEGNNQASVWDGNGWVSMEDARLATIIAAQEELESDLQDVQTSVDGKNKITYDPALPPASYVGVVGDTWYRTSGNSMIGFWKWDGAAWVQQALSTTVIPQIDIGAGTFGNMSGSRLQVGTVTADKLIIGSGGSLVPWAEVAAERSYAPHKLFTGTAGLSAALAPADAVRGVPPHVVVTRTSTGSHTFGLQLWSSPDNKIPLEANTQYTFSATLYSDTAATVRLAMVAYSQDGPGTLGYVGTIGESAAITLSSTPVKVTAVASSPANGFYVIPYLRLSGPSSVGFASPDIRKTVGTTLIQDGAITTDKLAVGSITAESGVIASLDLGKATVGELDGIRIMGQTIRGEQLSGDAIDGKVITGPTIQSAREGQRWVGDTTGIRIFNADNDVRTKLSPDGSVFKGEVEAETLVVNDGAELRGTTNTLAQGAKLTLAAGVTDPTAPPVVQPYWESFEFEISRPYTNVDGLVGLAYDGTHYWSAHKDDHGTGGGRARIFAVRIDPQTGVGEYVGGQLPTGKPRVAPWSSEVFGVTCIGSELFWLGRSYYDGVVWVTDLAGEFKRAFASPSIGYSAANPLTYRPGIGNDGANLVIAQCTDAGSLGWGFISKTNGSVLAGGLDRGDATKSDITGVYVGNGDLGTKHVLVAKKSTNTIQVFGTDGSATNHSWYTENGDVGIVFHDGTFHTLNPSGIVHEYTDTNTGDNSGDWWATYYWYTDVDDDNIIESTDYRSRMSPPTRFTWPRRAMLKILGQPMPTGVGGLGPALAKKTTKPTRTDFSGPGWSVDAGKPSARYTELPTNWTTYASPSDTNTFPEAESSVLESASGTFHLRGDGAGKWGPLTFNADGTMTGAIVSGQYVFPDPTANSVTSVEVTLPTGRFTTPPEVGLTLYTTSPDQVSVGAWPITTESFILNLHSTTSAARRVGWQAIDGS